MIRALVWAILCLALAGCSAASMVEPSPTEDVFYAPNFMLETLNGESVTLSDRRGRWVLVNFWATWCAPCVAEMPALQAIATERSDRANLLLINLREPIEAVRAFALEHAIIAPVLIDPPDSVMLDYGIVNLPQTFVIDPNGVVVHRQFGPIERDSFGVFLDELMQG